MFNKNDLEILDDLDDINALSEKISKYTDIPYYYKDLLFGKIRNYIQPYISIEYDVTEIIDNIFISDISSAFNFEELKKDKITHIITTILAVEPMYPDDFSYMNLHARDITNENLLQHFDKCYNFIEDALSSNGRVLIHCSYGISRSSTIVISYLIKKYKMTYHQAIDLVKSKRPVIEPNDGFKRQLISYDLLNRQ